MKYLRRIPRLLSNVFFLRSLIASRKNRRNLFTSFLHNIQTSGAARSGWRSWGTENTSRTIRQPGSCSREGISQPWENGSEQAPAPTRPPWAPLLFLLSLTSFFPLLLSSWQCWEWLGSMILELVFFFSLNSFPDLLISIVCRCLFPIPV